MPAWESLHGKSVTLRPITPGDAPALLAILAEPSVAAWWGAQPAQRTVDGLLEDGALVAEVDGGVAGALEVHEEDEPDYRHASFDLFLSAATQGRGIGREMLGLAIRRLISDGHHRFTIDPSAENDRAIRAYAAVGFRPVGTLRRAERLRDGEWHDSLLMEMLANELRD